MSLLIVGKGTHSAHGMCEGFFRNFGVGHSDLLLAFDGDGEFGGSVGAWGVGAWGVGAWGVGSVGRLHAFTLRRSDVLFHDRDEVHRADWALGLGVLGFNRGVHGAGVIIH